MKTDGLSVLTHVWKILSRIVSLRGMDVMASLAFVVHLRLTHSFHLLDKL
jgi:hypothetical protein